MDAQEFWTLNPSLPAFEIVAKLLGKHMRSNLSGEYSEHPVWHIRYSQDFELASVERELRQQLDTIEWQLVTTGMKLELASSETVLNFAVAPIIPVSVPVAYHATRRCLFEKIGREGLLPSTKERSSTNFPDTEGLIHVCAKLRHHEGENDSAEWWRDHLSTRNRHGDNDWGILRIDMSELEGARVYRDTHSKTGIVIDRVERIDPKLINPFEGQS